nr:MAG TPA: hypothetical protein [Caudoviricetes sp.]
MPMWPGAYVLYPHGKTWKKFLKTSLQNIF